MPPAPPSFVQLCRPTKITATPPAQRLQFLHDASIATTENLGAKLLAERCAARALAWTRDSLQNDVDPESWPTLLTPALLASLQGLYVLPQHKGAAPAPSNLRGLADILITYTPAPRPRPPRLLSPRRSRTHPVASTSRDLMARPAANASSAPPPRPPPNTSGGKWLMHDELLAALPADVY
jgi:hypothetical protein